MPAPITTASNCRVPPAVASSQVSHTNRLRASRPRVVRCTSGGGVIGWPESTRRLRGIVNQFLSLRVSDWVNGKKIDQIDPLPITSSVLMDGEKKYSPPVVVTK